jgi:hypothetical protein
LLGTVAKEPVERFLNAAKKCHNLLFHLKGLAMNRYVLLFATIALATTLSADEPVPGFDPAVPLVSDGKPIGGIAYPSPVLIDIDGDKQRELVIGDLFGNLWVCQQDSTGGALQWMPKTRLNSSNGKALRLPNW